MLANEQPMPLPGWTEEPLPEDVVPGRYRLYRRPRGKLITISDAQGCPGESVLNSAVQIEEHCDRVCHKFL